MIKLALSACVLSVLSILNAHAEEPRGCDKFAWPVDREQAALTGGTLAVLKSGSGATVSGQAFTLALDPQSAVKLPKEPERKAKRTDTFSGYVSFEAPSKGLYQVTLSGAAWIDVIQGDEFIKPTKFSGALDCKGVRKTVRFELSAAPIILQISDAPSNTLNLMVAKVSPAQN